MMLGKLKYLFLRFYLKPFLAFFVVFWILIYINSRDNTHFMNHAGMLIFLVIGLSALLGFINYLSVKYVLPSEFEKLVERKPFTQFIDRGFCVANGYLNGTVHGYQVLVGYHFDDYKIVRKLYVNIVFKPNTFGHFMTEEDLSKLNQQYKNEFIEWSINSLDLEFKFESFPPDFESIFQKIKLGVSILKNEGFEPSTLSDAYKVEKEIWDTFFTIKA